jgi:hypothetical protein
MKIFGSIRAQTRHWVRSPGGMGIVGFLLGTVFGLVILGWWLWPVEYTGAAPDVLLDYYQLDYLRQTIDSFSLTGDINLARTRFQQLGAHGPILLNELSNDPSLDKSKLTTFTNAIGASPASGHPDATPTASPVFPNVPSFLQGDALGAGIVVLVFLVVIGVGIVGVVRLSRRRSSPYPARGEEDLSFEAEEARSETGALNGNATARPAVPASEGQLLERFVTTYVLGDDLYEDSFTINSAAGEFLGECGVGISEPIGVGEPKKVTAFEIWLFDRQESKSSTTVFLSPYAFGKEDLKASLAPRGKPMLAAAGSDFWLETENLQLRVQVREIQFGKDPMPENSYFDRVMLQLEVWVR